MIELMSSTDAIRNEARELIANHGKSAITVAEWRAAAYEDNGQLEEARRWMIIAGTILAMTEP
jgi:hypothetical protein